MFINIVVIVLNSDRVRHSLVMLTLHPQGGFLLHPCRSFTRVSVMIISIVPLQTLRTREVLQLAQGHTANMQHVRTDSDTCVLNHA